MDDSGACAVCPESILCALVRSRDIFFVIGDWIGWSIEPESPADEFGVHEPRHNRAGYNTPNNPRPESAAAPSSAFADQEAAC
jgi:hypothetical protein